MRLAVTARTSLSAALALLVMMPAAALAQSFTPAALVGDEWSAVRGVTAMPADGGPVTVEVERGAYTLYFTAPLEQAASTARAGLATERGTSRTPTQSTPFANASESTVGWRYRYTFENDRALSVSYDGRITWGSGQIDVASPQRGSEYLARIEVARDFGRFTPRAEIGTRYVPRSAYEPQSLRSTFTAVGVSYRQSERSWVNAYFDYETAPASDMPALRSLSLNFGHQLSSRTHVALYAFRSLTLDKAYNAGVTLNMRF